MDGNALRWSEYRSMPWKNGGGTTREVASGTVHAPLTSMEPEAGFDWRVSVADVDAEGSFSTFPGIDRVITLVEGEGMVLTVDGTPHQVGPLRPFAFSGDAATDCRLKAGAVRNVNVMTRRSRATAKVQIITASTSWGTEMACATGETLLVMAITEGITVGGPDGRETTLGRFDCVRHEGPAALTLRSTGAVVGIRITALC
ncbi:HutD family protein [Streptomyces sp. NPDC087859]|uniref:HutD/Ves family protein n=1 Tax=Streptomyces sp. NPDC087859 TaxID=3365812 RepID=UPI0037F5E089